VFSKLSIATVAYMAGNVSALEKPTATYSSNRANSFSNEENYGCGECIMAGFNYVTDKWGKADLTAYSGFCCSGAVTDNTCVDSAIYTANAFVGSYAESLSWTSKDIAITKCPMKPTVCGSKTAFLFANTEDSLATVLVDKQRWTIQDSCTYKIETTCGAPAFEFETIASET
jgi:hypothetical protein